MKRWHIILLAVVALWLISGAVGIIPPIVNPFDNPQYAPGEATAMVERIRDIDLSRVSVTEKYLGRGAWEVRIPIPDKPAALLWRVYETSGTVDKGELVSTSPPTPTYIWAIIGIYGALAIEIIILIVKKARTKRVS